MAGPNDFTGQFISSTFQRVLQISGNGQITDGTGSIVSFPETDPVFSAKSGSLATTGSNSFSGSQSVTGSLLVTSGITGSLFGTSSWTQNALTASLAPNYVLNSVTGSFVRNSQTSSMLSTYVSISQTSSFFTGSFTGSLTGTLIGTSSWSNNAVNANNANTAGTALYSNQIFVGDIDTTTNAFKPFLLPKDVNTAPYYSPLDETSLSLNPLKNLIRFTPNGNGSPAQIEIGDPNTESNGSLVVWGPIWAQELNILPTTLNFVDRINTSSFSILSSLSFISDRLILSKGSFSGSFTGSLFGSASYALTASFAPNYVLNSSTGSMLAPYLLTSQTSSFIQAQQTSSMNVLSSSYSATASYALNATSGVSETLAIAYAVALG